MTRRLALVALILLLIAAAIWGARCSRYEYGRRLFNAQLTAQATQAAP